MQETWHWGSIPGSGQEDPLEEGLAAHSSVLAWRIPWQRSRAGYTPWGSQRVRRGWSNWACMTKFQAECRTFSKSSENKWFKLVWGLIFRSFPAFPTLSHDLLSILITDPDSVLIQTILMPWAYSSKYGFLVLLFSFLYDSEGTHMFLPSQDVLISKNILPENQFTSLPFWKGLSVFSSDINERKCSLHKCYYLKKFHEKKHQVKWQLSLQFLSERFATLLSSSKFFTFAFSSSFLLISYF